MGADASKPAQQTQPQPQPRYYSQPAQQSYSEPARPTFRSTHTLAEHVEAGNLQEVKRALDSGVDPNDLRHFMRDDDGDMNSPLMVAATCRPWILVDSRTGNEDIIGDPNACNTHAKIADALCKAGANVDWCLDSDKTTPLMIACGFNKTVVVRVLLKHYANINATDAEGNTPIMRAAHRTTHIACTALLLRRGADVSLRATSGRWSGMTVADIAHSSGAKRIVAMLREHERTVLKKKRKAGAPSTAPKRRRKSRATSCLVEERARAYVATLGDWADAYLDRRFDRCYCDSCYPAAWPDTISNEGPTPYVIPRGWFRFGLKLQPRAQDAELDIFNKWSVSFHGTKSPLVLKSVLQNGQLMKAGDTLLDGTKLRSTKCAGRQDKVFYTSPTIKYAGLKFYAEPQPFGGGLEASIALQCRQKPDSFKTQGETMNFESAWPGYLERECPGVNLGMIEWKSAINVAAIPYGLLIRTFEAGEDSCCSPVD